LILVTLWLSINSYAYEIIFSFTSLTYDDKGERVYSKNKVCQVVTGNKNTGLIFAGETFSRDENELLKYKQIAKSLII